MPTKVTTSFHANAVVIEQTNIVQAALQFPDGPIVTPADAAIDGQGSIPIEGTAAYYGIYNHGPGTIAFATGTSSGFSLGSSQGWPVPAGQVAWRKVPNGHTHIAVREVT